MSRKQKTSIRANYIRAGLQIRAAKIIAPTPGRVLNYPDIMDAIKCSDLIEYDDERLVAHFDRLNALGDAYGGATCRFL
jgi:hypothetical protein